ncbi:alpha-1,4-glucan--maltose-1-phosphate maltosyltransferase [Lewinellaceae bacterium SD302]|nr:alpha-1,4-glucan--maltose-1-phosphate maltosyltransferase [Lewinellaceae bacterium SD302]
MQNRAIIDHVTPQINNGRFAVKRVVGQAVEVTASVFGDGHDYLRAVVEYKHEKAKKWQQAVMNCVNEGDDLWAGSFNVDKQGIYDYQVVAWIDQLLTWRNGFLKKQADGQKMDVELIIGANLLTATSKLYAKSKAKTITAAIKKLGGEEVAAIDYVLSPEFEQLIADFPLRQFETTYDHELQIKVGRHKEIFSTWYELFPRSASPDINRTGNLRDVIELLPRVEEMGFDVLYMPPVHPIGKRNRKGRNNATNAKPGEPGSPWAIGSDEGGHKAILPELGDIKDYKALIKAAGAKNIDVALDLAFQCAPDHPYITDHPDWFIWRPDGTIAYAENPPKKYQDIVPINFETEDWKNLWEELLSVVIYWCKAGVKIFRVDNPHTKPFRFWEWIISATNKQFPDVIFLAEAFTRPKVMAELAKRGFQQSYSYFTWRTSPAEMREYLEELSQTELKDYMRPNFWPNTPDILAYEMMGANSNQFVKRLLLAGTLSGNYGLYGPSYELGENRGNTTGKEEYYDSEKYYARHYDWSYRNRTTDAYTRLNRARQEHPALQQTNNIKFTDSDNDQLLSYIKWSDDRSNLIWTIVNFDHNNPQGGRISVPHELIVRQHFRVRDLLTGDIYQWNAGSNYVLLDPGKWPAHIFEVMD